MSVKFKVKPIEEIKLTLCEWCDNVGDTSACGSDCCSCPLHANHYYNEYTHKEALVKITEINKEIK